MCEARAADVYSQSTARNRSALEILERSLEALGATKGRKSLILVSEGFIYDPNLDEFKRVVAGLAPREHRHLFPDTPRAWRACRSS